jgi:type IV pilus assembly protein PilO
MNLNELTLDNIGQWPLTIKVGILIGGGFLVIALGYWLILQDHFSEFNKLKEQEVLLKTDFETKQRQLYHLPAYREQLRVIEGRFASVLKQLPAQNEMPGLLEEISKTGVASGLKFELFAPQREVMHDFYVELPIKISVTGSYFQLTRFLSRVAEMKRLVTLDDLSIGGLPYKDHKMIAEDELVMRATVKIYRYCIS